MTFTALSALDIDLQRLPAPLPMWRGRVDGARWSAAARSLAAQGARLVSLWASRRQAVPAAQEGQNVACAAYATPEGLLWLELALVDDGIGPPDLTPHFACAARMQRAMADVSGVRAEGSRDQRP